MYVENCRREVCPLLGKEPKPFLWGYVKALSSLQAACFLKEEYELELSVEEIMAGVDQTVERGYFYDVQPKPGVVPFLEEMKRAGVRMCVATASERYQIEPLKKVRIDHYFEAVFTCTEVGHGKMSRSSSAKQWNSSGRIEATRSSLKTPFTPLKRPKLTALRSSQSTTSTKTSRKRSENWQICILRAFQIWSLFGRSFRPTEVSRAPSMRRENRLR